MMLTESNSAECQAKFNLSYHVPFARICQNLVGFEGKDVLEVGGSLPPEFVFDYLHVKSWSAIETPDYEESLKEAGGLSHKGTIIPNLKDISNLGFANRKLERYNFFLENIEDLPEEYYKKYDLIFSIATFEHIHKLPAALDKMFLALKPGGKLFSMFSPIWSAYDGHHLPKITDQSGKVFDFGNSPIPPWGHLLMKPDELCHYLYQYTDKETAELMVNYVYNSPHINRYFTEDYLDFIKVSKFKIEKIELTFERPIDRATQTYLENLYPKRNKFKNNGLLIVLERPTLNIKNQQLSNQKNQDDEKAMTNSHKSPFERLIPPEIKNDEFYVAIEKIAREENIKTILEIGSSSGEGSTEALVKGISANPNKPTLFCLEISQPRFNELKKRYQDKSFVKPYNISSVDINDIPKEQEVIDFYQNYKTGLNNYPLETVLNWFREGQEYLRKTGLTEDGIRKLKQENNIDSFDAVLIDGSQFTGSLELERVYGAKYIMLDDINTFKNYKNHRRLLADPNYELVAKNLFVRHGYSIFKKNQTKIFSQNLDLPIHFFTIVLNGEPFIRYHIDLFKQIPFKWHWHIIEGVADLKHDTSWCLKLGGRITDEIHKQGRSKDGTSKYLDQLAAKYPENVTIYRKPEGVFWDGKREMVNAPLANIKEECLLWQVDVDEIWTLEQICNTRKLFIKNPEKTAAFYWCWYFVGENLVISTRNCYAQNPQQEWLRTWRFKPGMVWVSHSPPRLAEPLPNGQWRNVASVNPLWHHETEKQGLVFQHFAYVTPEQLRFKEQYYGYQNAVIQWQTLQSKTNFPVYLREYFGWVRDNTMVDRAESLGIVPLIQKDVTAGSWKFLQPEYLQRPVKMQRQLPIIIIDAVFFQMYRTGIARVWKSLLEEWAVNGFAKQIIVLDRAGTAPKIAGIRYRTVPAYDYSKTDTDRITLQQICDEEKAELFISTYYTTPLSTPSVFMGYDMIPEVMQANLAHPMWREKHYAINHASAYITISENTARDLKTIFPNTSAKPITVAPCGVKSPFSPASNEEINNLKAKYGITKPYFMLVGASGGYKNTTLFFQAFAKLENRHNFDIICTGASSFTADELKAFVGDSNLHKLHLSDEELRLAYSGAVALVYPSKYEGFGLPIIEALACGCPVITCANASIPEVAGQAAIYVKDDDINALGKALLEIQKPEIRQSLITTGLAQAKKFSWSQMADIVSSVLLETTSNINNPHQISSQASMYISQGEQQMQQNHINSPQPLKVGNNLAPYATALAKYQQNPTDQIAVDQIRLLRQQIAQQWLNLPLNQLESTYLGEIGKAHQGILNTTLKNEPLTEQEQTFINQLTVDIAKGSNDPKFINYLLAAMLYRRADQLPLQYEGVPIPKWFINDYFKFMLYSPNYFQEIGEIDTYYQHIQRWLDVLYRKIFANQNSDTWQNIALLFTQNHNFIPLYFTKENLKDIYTKRAEIMEFAFRKLGHQIDYVFPSRPSKRTKIRLGVLNADFTLQKETFITIPAFEHLNREQFEIILYANNVNGHPLEQYCQSRADKLVKLPSDLPNQVQTIRADDLDILLIGTNVTALSNSITLLALHRLARVQVTSVSSCVTTGMPNIDYYISGSLTEPGAEAQAQYQEKLITLNSPAHCFNYYPIPTEPSTVKPTRSSWGATDESVVFISGANFYKIIPEMRETWAKILAKVPNSILLLYPFNPNWSNQYPAGLNLINNLRAVFAKYGIAPNRLTVIKPLPSRADIKECLKLGDVYLDSYPFSGVTSLFDPLEVALPPVVMDGNSFRSLMAPALLRDLQIPDLIANSEESYINLAINLANNPALRQQKRAEISQKMQNNPRFLDSRAYSAQMGEVFQKLWQEWQKANGEQPTLSIDTTANQTLEQPKSSIDNAAYQTLEHPLDSPQFIKQLNGCINLYEIDPSDESVLAELRSLRQSLADFWLNLPPEQLQSFYLGNVGKAHQLLAQGYFKQQKLTDSEQIFVDGLSVNLAKGFNTPKAINYRLVAMLYPLNNPVLSESDKSRLPAWLK